MKKVSLITALFFSFMAAQDLSCRIKALGDNFAILVPDYETDVLYNPIFLSQNLLGVYYKTFEETPIKLTFLYRSIGLNGLYWPTYDYELESNGTNWEVNSTLSDRLKIVGLFKIKGIGVSITPDISRSREKSWNSVNYSELQSSQKFMYTSSVGFKLLNKFFLFVEPAVGFWEELNKVQNNNLKHQEIIMPSGKLRILYRNLTSEQRFISAFLDVGGPTSISDFDELPLSPYSHFVQIDRLKLTLPFGLAFLTNFGICLGFPVNDNSLLAIGLKEKYIAQFVLFKDYYNYPVTLDSIGIAEKNRITLPIATEHMINRVAIRFGINFHYDYYNLAEWVKNSKWEINSQTISDVLDYSYTFGLGWKTKDNLIIDLRYEAHYWRFDLRDWSVYLKYLF